MRELPVVPKKGIFIARKFFTPVTLVSTAKRFAQSE